MADHSTPDLSESQDSDVEQNDEVKMDQLTVHEPTGRLAQFRQRARLRLKSNSTPKRKSTKLVHQLPKHTAGLTWARVLKGKLRMYHPTYSGNYKLTFRALQLSWGMLLVLYFVTAFLIAAIMAGLFWAADCHENLTFSQVFLVVSQQVMTGPAFMEMTDRATANTHDSCIVVGLFSSMASLFFQTFVISLVIRKYMKPKSSIAFSRRLVFNIRNGVPCLQARIFNLRGTLMTNIRLTVHHAYPRTTLEGESHWNMNPLTFTGANFIKLPGTNWLKTDEDWIVDGDVNWAMADHLATGTYTHLIDAKSPLYEFYKQDAVIGTITFEVVGYDHVLHEDIHQIWMFRMPEDAAPCSRYADVVSKGTEKAIEDGSLQLHVDMANYDAIIPTHGPDRCCMLCMRGCAFGSAAARKQASNPKPSSTPLIQTNDLDHQPETQVASLSHAPVELDALVEEDETASVFSNHHESVSAHDLLAGAEAELHTLQGVQSVV